MSTFRRGKIYWFEFVFQGQRVRDSAHTRNLDVARRIERQRRQKMEESAGGVRKFKPLLFRKAGKTWLEGNAHWSDSYREINTLKLSHLLPTFGKLLLTEITADAISKFQRKRQSEGASGREVNMETGVLRMILRTHKLWHLIEPDFRPLPENEETGRALLPREANKLLDAALKSRSRSLFPALLLYFHTGTRVTELRLMRWRQVDLVHKTITVGRSKTRGGQGRVIPLNEEAYEVLVEWQSRFSNPQPDHFVFPSERYGFDGDEGRIRGAVSVYDLDPESPMGSWKTAWTNCRKTAGVWCRLHDLRLTFISALGEAGVPESTMTALAGWMSRKMLERYSHTRNDAKRKAVKRLPKRLRP